MRRAMQFISMLVFARTPRVMAARGDIFDAKFQPHILYAERRAKMMRWARLFCWLAAGFAPMMRKRSGDECQVPCTSICACPRARIRRCAAGSGEMP